MSANDKEWFEINSEMELKQGMIIKKGDREEVIGRFNGDTISSSFRDPNKYTVYDEGCGCCSCEVEYTHWRWLDSEDIERFKAS